MGADAQLAVRRDGNGNDGPELGSNILDIPMLVQPLQVVGGNSVQTQSIHYSGSTEAVTLSQNPIQSDHYQMVGSSLVLEAQRQ